MQLRHAFAVATIAASITLTAGCARRQVEVTTGSTTNSSTTASNTAASSAAGAASAGGMGAMTMSAQLVRQGGSSVGGTANVTHGDSPNQFRASLGIFGAGPNATHPWHVHEGRCGENGAVVGPPDAYPPLQTDAHGAASQNAVVPVAMPAGPLSVNVHLSAKNMQTIVSCGNLAM